MTLLISSSSPAVSSKITRHSTAVDLLKGETDDIVIDSRGTIELGRAAELLAEEFEDAWSINSIVTSGETVFLGTSPNGGIYKYSLGKLSKIYPVESSDVADNDMEGNADSNDSDGNGQKIQQDEYLSNEHIFAMATDLSGRLLAAVSGKTCKLLRFSVGKVKTIYEPNDANYIFAITVADDGDIYLGTGPQGKIYRLNSFGNNPTLIYDSPDKNILSLAVDPNGMLYAGSDTRGLVYCIDMQTKKATVLYDSGQQEITALLVAENGDLYAAATSAGVVLSQNKFSDQPSHMAGRPDTAAKTASSTGLKLKIANTKKTDDKKTSGIQMPAPKALPPTKLSYIYRITPDGFATRVFHKTAVLFNLASRHSRLLVGTGNMAQLFSIEPATEQEKQIYEDPKSSQITAIAVTDDGIYIGTANPARMLRLTDGFAAEGTYTSALIDAGQPSKWGKLQIDADIPQFCTVIARSRSGNVKDINDPTFSEWTKPVEITEPVQLQCPVARFCQYELLLKSSDDSKSPAIREIAVANTVPNLAPKVKSVSVSKAKSTSGKGVVNINHKAVDKNSDKLVYKIEFRKIPRTGWIELEEETEKTKFEWDSKTVEDGRYEIKVTADDIKSNTPATALTATRISEPVVVDNTAPVIESRTIDRNGRSITLKLKVSDELSAISQVHYTVDSNADWILAMPDDMVYDTTEESFTITIEDLSAGEHIISIKAADDPANTMYKTFDVNI